MSGRAQIVRQGRAVRLEAKQGTFSYFHPDRLFTSSSWDALSASLLLVRRPLRSILILGLGGGTTARQCRALWPSLEIVGVEIESEVLALARRHFDLDSIGVRTVRASGQKYLETTRRRFDAILDDMWALEPARLKPFRTEPDWARTVADRLLPGGVYSLNVYRRREDAAELPEAISLLRRAFPDLAEVRPPNGPTTVLAGGLGLRSTRRARRALRRLPAALASGLRSLRFRTL